MTNIVHKSKEGINDTDLLNICWSYFEIQSQQRLQMINFFITVEAVLIGAFFTLLITGSGSRWMLFVVDSSIALTTISFWGIDNRLRVLLSGCIDCISSIENNSSCLKEHLLMKRLLVQPRKFPGKSFSFWFDTYFLCIVLFSVIIFIMLLKGVL